MVVSPLPSVWYRLHSAREMPDPKRPGSCGSCVGLLCQLQRILDFDVHHCGVEAQSALEIADANEDVGEHMSSSGRLGGQRRPSGICRWQPDSRRVPTRFRRYWPPAQLEAGLDLRRQGGSDTVQTPRVTPVRMVLGRVESRSLLCRAPCTSNPRCC